MMMTTADVKRIGLSTTTATRKTKRTQRVRAYYDFEQKSLTIVRKGKAAPAPYGIVLQDVTFTIEPGKRVGCADTGELGFISGNLVQTHMSNGDVAKLLEGKSPRQIVWDGHRFVDCHGRTQIRTASRIVIRDKLIQIF